MKTAIVMLVGVLTVYVTWTEERAAIRRQRRSSPFLTLGNFIGSAPVQDRYLQ